MKIVWAMFLFLFQINSAFAGDEMPAGSVLKQDSYVFTIESAKRLQDRLAELEKKEKLLLQYEKLEELYSKKILLYEDNMVILNKKTENLDSIIISLENQNENLIKKVKYNDLENGLIIAGSVVTTILAFIAVDYINDNFIDK